MNDILFGNNNKAVIQKLAKRSLKSKKNTIAILAIMLATLLFTSLFTIAISLQTAMQESNMRTTGTSAHAGIKRLSWEEYEQLSSDAGIKDSGYSIIIGNAVGENFNKVPTELRYGDETYANLTFNDPDIGRLPEQKNEVATSRIVLAAMGLPDKVGTQMELTFITDTDTFTDTFTLCGIWDGDAVAYRQTMFLSKEYTKQVAPVIHGKTDGTTPPVGTGYIDSIMMMPTAWDIEKQAMEVTSKYGLDERVSINDAYGTATISLSSMLPLVAGISVIFIAGYLLIYNVFYISIAQDITASIMEPKALKPSAVKSQGFDKAPCTTVFDKFTDRSAGTETFSGKLRQARLADLFHLPFEWSEYKTPPDQLFRPCISGFFSPNFSRSALQISSRDLPCFSPFLMSLYA